MVTKVPDEELGPQFDCKVVHKVQARTELKVPVKLGQDFKHSGFGQLVVFVNGFEDDLDLLFWPQLSITNWERVQRIYEPVHKSLDNGPFDLAL